MAHTKRTSKRLLVFELTAIVCVCAAASTIVLARGFDHVSDDDFARVTIAQTFAHAPRLDPSGTSWLPFPFWSLGGAMALVGRSLAAARATSVLFASLAATLPYLALRTVGASRQRAWLAVAFAVLSPWSLWLSASTVPESFTASFTAAAAIGLGASGTFERSAWTRFGFALSIFAACLSRYEPWPVAAVLAATLLFRAARRRSTNASESPSDDPVGSGTAPLTPGLATNAANAPNIALAVVVALGPCLWMAWNAHAHGSAVHFFHRVSNYKRAIGEGSTDTFEALLLYPRLLFGMRPDVLAATACALPLLRDARVRRRWGVPLACAFAELAFLAYGNARDGAPAHHSERALLGIVFVLAAFSVDVLGEALPSLAARSRGPVLALTFALVLGWLAGARGLFGEQPGTSAYDDRAVQVARGLTLRDEHVSRLRVTPCAFEHFALIAAYGAPENVEIRPKTSAPLTADCPRVETP